MTVLVSMFLGCHRGFILGVLDVITWVGSLGLAFVFYGPLAGWLKTFFNWSETWIRPTAFIAIALIGIFSLAWASRVLFQKIPERFNRKFINHLLGVAPGLINGITAMAVVTVMLLLLPLPSTWLNTSRDSVLTRNLMRQAENFESALDGIFGEAISKAIINISNPSQVKERIELSFIVINTEPRPELEDKMLEIVNAARNKEGLAPLESDPGLKELAREHSTDMLTRGYFGHISPEGTTPVDRMRLAGISFLAAGENLALAPNLSSAHEGLMASKGHRLNILRPQFGRIGIGIMDAGSNGLMVTQMFRN